MHACAAVDASQFKPDESKRRPGRLTVVALSRLVYRKGIDLLVVIIPEMCYRYPQVDFVIGMLLTWLKPCSQRSQMQVTHVINVPKKLNHRSSASRHRARCNGSMRSLSQKLSKGQQRTSLVVMLDSLKRSLNMLVGETDQICM